MFLQLLAKACDKFGCGSCKGCICLKGEKGIAAMQIYPKKTTLHVGGR